MVFNEEPLRNEPGFEHASTDQINLYSKVINFSNYKVSIIDQLNHNLGNFEVFKEVIIEYFKNNIEYYDNKIEELCKNENIQINTPAYGMNVYLDYVNLKKYFKTLKVKIIK